MTIEQERDIAVRALEEALSIHTYTHPSHEARCGAMRGAISTALAAIAAQASPVAQDERAKGRAEAMQLIMSLDPETGLGDYIGWSSPVGPEDEGAAYWDADKLRELLHVDSALADMLDKAEAEYLHNMGLRQEFELIAAQFHTDARSNFESLHPHLALNRSTDGRYCDFVEDRWLGFQAGRASVAVPASPTVKDSLTVAQAAQPMGEAVAWEPKFEAIALAQEKLAVELSMEIAGKRGQKPSLPDAVRLLEMAETLYIAERDDATIGRKVPPVAQDQDAGLRIAHAEAVEKVDRLSAEVLGLRNAPEYPDSARLDWVARHGASLRIDPKDECWYFVAPYRTKIDCVDEHRRFDSPRAAIDAAMQAEVQS